jgi:crossover junction endodeoxyribonuclease RusA
MTLELPFPPTGNHYKRLKVINGRPHWYLTKAAKAFHKEVWAATVGGERFGTARLRVTVILHAPDGRAYDIDNRAKVLLDALQAAGVYQNDRQIDELLQYRGEPGKAAKVVVRIEPIGRVFR